MKRLRNHITPVRPDDITDDLLRGLALMDRTLQAFVPPGSVEWPLDVTAMALMRAIESLPMETTLGTLMDALMDVQNVRSSRDISSATTSS